MREFLNQCIEFYWTSQGGHIKNWLLNYQLYVVIGAMLLASLARPAYRWTRRMWVGLGHDYFHGVVLALVFYPLVAGFTATLQLAVDRFAPWLNLRWYEHVPTAARVLVAILVGDFAHFLSHYLTHRIRCFWHFHAVHHSQRQLNSMTAKRVHFGDALLVRCLTVSVPLVIMGVRPQYWPAYYLFDRFWDYVAHSNWRTSFGPLKYVLVSPLYHRLHHSSLPRHFDKNLANRFVIWDLLCGTACFDFVDHPTGISCREFPHEESLRPSKLLATYAGQVVYPFRMNWRDLWGTGKRSGEEPAVPDAESENRPSAVEETARRAA